MPAVSAIKAPRTSGRFPTMSAPGLGALARALRSAKNTPVRDDEAGHEQRGVSCPQLSPRRDPFTTRGSQHTVTEIGRGRHGHQRSK